MYKICKIVDKRTNVQVGHPAIVIVESKYEKEKRKLAVYGLEVIELKEGMEGMNVNVKGGSK